MRMTWNRLGPEPPPSRAVPRFQEPTHVSPRLYGTKGTPDIVTAEFLMKLDEGMLDYFREMASEMTGRFGERT